ncbi:MAG: hypothetical protein DRR08_16765 [Candidatus Parabeggiatoa sp. nov. 2]|nr:MAG: hypothetical protein B6247_10075 [Beggiatoa sp. 4572_84]RKZ58330.1 MAG: hypothetical protein DRR08_16765 [Gammaproteobacteria bacterium]
MRYKHIAFLIAVSLGISVAPPVLADSPKSCKALKEKDNSTLSGVYTIDPDGNGGNEPFEVYCDMESDNVGLTFYLVTNGLTTFKVTDNDSCQELGLKIFAPRTEEDYDRARQYLLSIGAQGSFGPLGVYNPTDGPGTSYTPMNSDHAGTQFGWTSTAGDKWWISDRSDISEPSGDYIHGEWLGILYNEAGNVRWYNDAPGGYSYSSYLCMSEDNYAAVSDDGDCQHASYNLKDRTLSIPFVELPLLDVWSGQPTGEVELFSGVLKQKYKTTEHFRLLSKTVSLITDGSSSSCPATYSFDTGVLSIPYINVPTTAAMGGNKFDSSEVEVFKATLTWEQQERVFVVKEIEKLP